MGHPIHKHMSSGQRYDDKQAYNKDLPASERLHYLENEEHDKGMSRHSSPANNVSYGDKSGVTGYIGEQRADLMKYNPVDDKAGMSRHTTEHSTEEYMSRKDAAIKKSQGKDGMSRYASDDQPMSRYKKAHPGKDAPSRYSADQGDSPAKGLGDTLKKIGRTVTRGLGDIGMQAVDMIRPDHGSHASGRRPPGATSYQEKYYNKEDEKAHYQKSRDLAAQGKTYGSLSSFFDDDGEGGTPKQTSKYGGKGMK